jgi:hypothetical protein
MKHAPPLDPDSRWLQPLDKKLDRDRRLSVMIVVGVLGTLCVIGLLRPSDLGLGDSRPLRLALPVGSFLLGSLVAWWGGVPGRGRALWQRASIVAENEAATKHLLAGEIEAARPIFQRLLPRVAALGQFHAQLVSLYAVCRFYEGASLEAGTLLDRVFRSGWLEGPTHEVLVGWRIGVHLAMGELDTAERLLAECKNAQNKEVSELIAASHRERWEAVSRRARAALLTADLRDTTRWSAAVLGLYVSAPQRGNHPADHAHFTEFLRENPTPPFAAKNPALSPFLPEEAEAG